MLGIVKFLDRLRKVDAENQAKEILDRANRDAAAKVKEVELAIKERELASKQETEKALNKSRDELRERERTIEKRVEQMQQQADDLRKQERIVETTQRRLAERLEDASRRNEELSKLVEAQRQHQRSFAGRSVEAAARYARKRTAIGDGEHRAPS